MPASRAVQTSRASPTPSHQASRPAQKSALPGAKHGASRPLSPALVHYGCWHKAISPAAVPAQRATVAPAHCATRRYRRYKSLPIIPAASDLAIDSPASGLRCVHRVWLSAGGRSGAAIVASVGQCQPHRHCCTSPAPAALVPPTQLAAVRPSWPAWHRQSVPIRQTAAMDRWPPQLPWLQRHRRRADCAAPPHPLPVRPPAHAADVVPAHRWSMGWHRSASPAMPCSSQECR